MLEGRHFEKHISTPEKLEMVHNMKYWLVAFLAFIIWDIIITFDEEVRYIWRLPRFSPTKWVFLATRYFSIWFLSRTVSLYVPLSLSSETAQPAACRKMSGSQRMFSGVLLLCAQALLMSRMYALYFRDRRVAIGIGLLVLVQLPIIPVTIIFSNPVEYTIMCISISGVKDSIIFVIISVIPLIIILGFTITKYVMARKAGWGQIPIVSRLVKDDIALVASLVFWVILTVLITNFSNPVHGYIALYWTITFVPYLYVCRIVISMQRLGVGPQGLPYSQRYPQFTSVPPNGTSRIAHSTLLSSEYPTSDDHSRSVLPGSSGDTR
ncbi:hypothetical protein BDQ17DRAFT_1376859 [Cyathus striatus]|nr:hypothetical protein BDQ17DRAFT_1376859 [Cyathus striatus]